MATQSFVDGTVNIAGLTVPGVYIDIVPPQPNVTGSPTNIMGVVGIAQWGPVGAPQFFNTPDQCAGIFGVPVIRTGDLPTYVWAASQQGGAVAFAGVRVTDGTDTAASAVVLTNCITFTGKYTGSRGNQITVTLSSGTAASSYAAAVTFPGRQPEIFNNITGSANALWVNLAAAINNGNAYRGPSNYITASAGAGTTAPVLGTAYTLSGGTDGVATLTSSVYVGTDTLPRKGMYALRSSGIDAFALCDVVDNTTWLVQTAFGLSENCFPVLTDSAGDSISSAVTTRATAGLDTFYAWLLMGDWPTFSDTQNSQTRLISPQAIALGLLGNLAPNQSPLNKPLNNVVATQRSQQGIPYAAADISNAEQGGIDLIVPPANAPGGNYFTFITGRNAWSNTGGNGLEFTRMTFFLARSFAAVGGKFVGQLQSVSPNDPTRLNVWTAFNSFMTVLANPAIGAGGYGMIDSQWVVQCDLNNNTPQTQALGYLFVYVTVRYLNVVRYFVVKLAGGGNVTVTSQATQPAPSQFAA